MDADVSKNFQRMLKKQGIDLQALHEGHRRHQKRQVALPSRWSPPRAEKRKRSMTDVVLVSIGRRPYTEGLGLEAAGVALDDRGRVAD